MHPYEIALGLICGLTLTVSYGFGARDAPKAALALLLIWFACWLSRLAFETFLHTPPLSYSVGASLVLDLAFGLYVASLHDRNPARWKSALSLLIALQIVVHGALALNEAATPTIRNRYRLMIDVLFFAQHATVWLSRWRPLS